jgi:tetratricopeptide (TPR) repeat protein
LLELNGVAKVLLQRKKEIMNKLRNLFCLATLFVIMVSSCERKLAPSISVGKQEKSYDSANFDRFFVEAIKQKLLGNGGDALQYLELCLKVNPLSGAVFYQMAQIVANNGDLNSSKKYLIKALSIEPKNYWYLIMISSIYYQAKNIDSAIIYYENAVKYFPEKESLKINLGKLYFENRNYEKAYNVFNDLDFRLGVNETTTVFSIKSLIAAGKYKDAETKVKLLLKDFPEEVTYNGLLADIYQGEGEINKAMEVYDKLIERNPNNSQIQLSLCYFLISCKKFDELIKLLNNVSINMEINRDEKISLFARILEIDELVKAKEAQLQLALMVLEASYKSDDVIPLLRPELCMKAGKISDSRSILEEIIRVKPENYYAWEKLLLVYLQEKQYNKLETKGEECATMFNGSFLAKILYANGAMENKNYVVALDEVRKATILAGDDKNLNLQVLTLKADIYYRMKDFDNAFKTFEEALKLNSEDLTIINNYAYYLAEQNSKLKEAELLSKKVIEKERKNTAYLDTYGWILYKRGKYKAAGKIMEEVISSGEAPDAEWYEHYGYILKSQKNCLKAIENWETALKIDSTKSYLKNEIQNCRKIN